MSIMFKGELNDIKKLLNRKVGKLYRQKVSSVFLVNFLLF